MQSKKHIFLSYSRVDSAFALQIANDLKSHNFNIWIDQYHIPEGVHWDDTIEEALKNSCAMIVILSPDSVASDRVKDEVSYALENDIQVLPIMYKQTEVPYRWRRIQFVEINESNYSHKMERFIKSIENFATCNIDTTQKSLMSKTEVTKKRINIYPFMIAGVVAAFMVYFLKNEIMLNSTRSIVANNGDHNVTITDTNSVYSTELPSVKKVISQNKNDNTTKNSPNDLPKITQKSDKIKQTAKQKITHPARKSKSEKKCRVTDTFTTGNKQQKAVQKKNYPHKPLPVEEKILIKPHTKDQYIAYLKNRSDAKLVVLAHTNAQNDYEEAQKRVYHESLDLRRNGLSRSQIVTKIVPDRLNKITYNLKIPVH